MTPMGNCKSKTYDNDDDGAVVAGSTYIRGRSVMIIGDSILLPMRDRNTDESSVIEVDLKHRNVKILKGVGGRMTHRFLNSSLQNKKIKDKAFISIAEDDEESECKESIFDM